MSRRRRLLEHRENLAEIREIMNSMKTLAYMETRKLARFLAAQQAVVEAQRRAAEDLLRFHPDLLPQPPAGAPVPGAALYLLLGSERGLCGDFNQALLRFMERGPALGEGPPGALLCIGHKLAGLLDEDPRLAGVIEGASIVEEVPLRLPALVSEIRRVQRERGLLGLYAVVHAAGGVEAHPLVPPFRQLPDRGARQAPASGVPPLLHESPGQVFARLVDQYVPALLQWLLYTALMEENHLRVTHLESAVRHLDEEAEALTRRGNVLRQEEIVEEIEVILLSAASIAANRAAMG